jgi:hypothetical protein
MTNVFLDKQARHVKEIRIVSLFTQTCLQLEFEFD